MSYLLRLTGGKCHEMPTRTLGTGKLFYSLLFKRILKSILIPFGFQISQIRPVIKRTNLNGPIYTFLPNL